MSGHSQLQQRLALHLEERRSQQLWRERRTIESPQQPLVKANGKQLLSFCSNDYLGLANHPAVAAAFKRGVDEFGAGSGASHLVTGHTAAHAALEEELAAFTGRSKALLFGSGFMANVGVLAALFGKGDVVLEDKLNHASLLDGGMFCGATFKRYPHADTERLAALLQASEQGGLQCIVSDGVFSMDGDIAPLPALLQTAEQHNAIVMIDDAHGFGCLGEKGGGVVELAAAQGIDVSEQRLSILVGTLGKAFGTVGAFVTGSEALIESLIQFCRPYIYTTALPAAVAVATRTSLQLVQQESWRRQHLQALVQRFRQGAQQLGLPLLDSSTPIQGLLLQTPERALAASRQLEARGILVTAIRPPTVPPLTARLRITFCANHNEQQVDRLLDALGTLALPEAKP